MRDAVINGKCRKEECYPQDASVEGGTVSVVSEAGGSIIVNVKDSRVAIGREMANKIMVG